MNTTTLDNPSVAPVGSAVRTQPAREITVAQEAHWRSVVKGISWRVIGTIDTMVISYIVTGKPKIAISIGAVELFTKIFLYYVHERAWHRIPYGRTTK